jgi:hypothetical protein
MEKTDINTVIKKKGNKGDGCNIWNESWSYSVNINWRVEDATVIQQKDGTALILIIGTSKSLICDCGDYNF